MVSQQLLASKSVVHLECLLALYTAFPDGDEQIDIDDPAIKNRCVGGRKMYLVYSLRLEIFKIEIAYQIICFTHFMHMK